MYNLLNPERHSTSDLLYLKEKKKKGPGKETLRQEAILGRRNRQASVWLEDGNTDWVLGSWELMFIFWDM